MSGITRKMSEIAQEGLRKGMEQKDSKLRADPLVIVMSTNMRKKFEKEIPLLMRERDGAPR